MIQLKPNRLTTEWHTIHLGDSLGEFEIEVRRPTWDEINRDAESAAGFLAERLEALIVNWRGVQNGEAEVPYSWEKFQNLCAAYPSAFRTAIQIVSAYFFGLDEATEKN